MAQPAQARRKNHPHYRINPEVEGKIDAHIKENPKYWNYVQAMPRDRLERTVVLNEVRQLERQQRMREGMMKKINANPELKQAYETLVKDVPEEQREEVMTPDCAPDPARRFPLTNPAANERSVAVTVSNSVAAASGSSLEIATGLRQVSRQKNRWFCGRRRTGQYLPAFRRVN